MRLWVKKAYFFLHPTTKYLPGVCYMGGRIRQFGYLKGAGGAVSALSEFYYKIKSEIL